MQQQVRLDRAGSKKGQIVQLLLLMDQRSAVCWMDECVHCVFALSILAQTARLYIEEAKVHCWVQEMTMIMPNVPFASVSFMVMDMVCNRVKTWRQCAQASAFFFFHACIVTSLSHCIQ